jgi:uncharacterized repeat protein (TIGR03833 family)
LYQTFKCLKAMGDEVDVDRAYQGTRGIRRLSRRPPTLPLIRYSPVVQSPDHPSQKNHRLNERPVFYGEWEEVQEMEASMDGRNRANIRIGTHVKIVLKADQPTGKLTEGIVARLLTNSSFHPHGIKVMLEDRQVGRVAVIVESPAGNSAKAIDPEK